MRSIVLASTSPYRKAQLEQLQLSFETMPPGVDEDRYKAKDFSPKELAERLSIAKAKAVFEQCPDAIVIGGDQVVEFDGEMLEKPETSEKAIKQLRKLAGKSHHLWSGLAVVSSQGVFSDVAKTTLVMRSLTEEQIETYIARDQPLDCVGSYRIESVGISLFSSIEGSDHTAIVGLPLMRLVSLLEKVGVSVLC